jgi:hypothetical protein
LDVNTSRVQGDLENRLAIARKELELATRGVLERAKDAAHETFERAREVRDAGQPVVEARLEWFAELQREINELAREASWIENRA